MSLTGLRFWCYAKALLFCLFVLCEIACEEAYPFSWAEEAPCTPAREGWHGNQDLHFAWAFLVGIWGISDREGFDRRVLAEKRRIEGDSVRRRRPRASTKRTGATDFDPSLFFSPSTTSSLARESALALIRTCNFHARNSPREPSDVLASCKHSASRLLQAFVCWMMRRACWLAHGESGACGRGRGERANEGEKEVQVQVFLGGGRAQKARPPVETFGPAGCPSCPSFLRPPKFFLSFIQFPTPTRKRLCSSSEPIPALYSVDPSTHSVAFVPNPASLRPSSHQVTGLETSPSLDQPFPPDLAPTLCSIRT